MNRISSLVLYVITFITAACSLVYELLIAQTISFFASNTVVWYSLTIGVYLVSMGIGALLADRFMAKKELFSRLVIAELLLSLAGAVSVGMIHTGQMAVAFFSQHGLVMLGTGIFYGIAFLSVSSVGFLTGLELPILIRIGEAFQTKNILNKILSADYFGSLAGGVLFPIVLFPNFELITISWITAAVNTSVAIFLLRLIRDQRSRVLSVISITALSCWILLFSFSNAISQYLLNRFYYYDYPGRDLTAQRERSAYQKIDLVELPVEDSLNKFVAAFSRKYVQKPDFPHNWALFIDGYFQLWADFEELYHEYFAHMPVQLNGAVPKHVLILGAGDGCLLRELIKYQGIQSITMVEIDAHMIDLARHHQVLSAMNQHALEDRRVKIVIADAYHYIRNSKEKFDAVYLDFPVPKDYNLSKIFSYEFYTFIYQHLTDGGYAVLDAPRVKLSAPLDPVNTPTSPETFIYQQTLLKSGFSQIIKFGSDLEADRNLAKEIFDETIGDNNQLIVHEMGLAGEETKVISGKDEIAWKMLQYMVSDYREEFFMMQKKEHPLGSEFIDYGIPLLVFNPARFSLARKNMQTFNGQEPDESLVNSMMRPTLPLISDWQQVKIPY